MQVKVAEANIQFQSTLPAWGATAFSLQYSRLLQISIHAPRMGSDCYRDTACPPDYNFNPRSPHGERPTMIVVFPLKR